MEQNNSNDNIDFNELFNPEDTPEKPIVQKSSETEIIPAETSPVLKKKKPARPIRIILIIGAVFIIFLGSVSLIPVFFKEKLLKSTQEVINQNAKVNVKFEDFNVSLLRNFPKITLNFKNITVMGTGEFKSDTLLVLSHLRTKLSLLSLFGKDNFSIGELTFLKPDLRLITNKTGHANWDIFPEEKPADKTKNEGFNLKLDKIEIVDGNISYLDREIDMLTSFDKINMKLNGKMYGTSAELEADGKVEKFSLIYDKVKYISNSTLETKTLFNVDYDKLDIVIKKNELLYNRLPLEVLGNIQMPGDSMFFDLGFKSKQSDFSNLLALIPPDYDKYMKNITSGGQAIVEGKIKGLYYNEIYPEFSLNVNISGGRIKYAGMPEEVQNIKGVLTVLKPEGDLDLAVVKVKEAHAQIRNNPVDFTLMLSKPMSDLNFDAGFVGKINFDQLKDAFPMDSVNVSGILDANLFVKGDYTSVEKEEYDKISSEGIVLLDNFKFESKELTQPVQVSQGKLDFSPQKVNLSQMDVKIGSSVLNLQGNITNYLNYLFKKGELKGDMTLHSDFVNVDELLRLQKQDEKEKSAKTKKTADSQAETLAFNVPDNMDITFKSSIGKALYDKLNITSITGLVTAKGGKLILNGLNMNMLDGQLGISGSYQNNARNQPDFDFVFDISRFDIPKAFYELTFFGKIAPIAGKSQGKISTNIKMKGQLAPDLSLAMVTLQGLGLVSTESVQIVESPVMKELKGILRSDLLKKVEVDDFKANIVVENGSIVLKPFTTRIAGQETTINGWINAENLVNMRMDFKIERDAFGNEVQSLLSLVPGNSNISIIPASVYVNGPVKNPSVKLDLSEAKKTITNQVKKSTTEELQNTINKIGGGIKKLFK